MDWVKVRYLQLQLCVQVQHLAAVGYYSTVPIREGTSMRSLTTYYTALFLNCFYFMHVHAAALLLSIFFFSPQAHVLEVQGGEPPMELSA